MSYSIEDIPDADRIFYRVHDSYFSDGILNPGVFRENGEGIHKSMSTNWEKYASAAITQGQHQAPQKNSVVSLIAGDVRTSGLKVDHSPLESNRAHTDVRGIGNGPAKDRIRLILYKLIQWEIETAIAASRTQPG